MSTFITRPLDRWDLIATDNWKLPELGWAIAEANPELSHLLIMSGGIEINLPALESLRRPLTAANPAREEGGQFLEVPGSASPLPSPSPSPGPAVQFPITIAQGGTEAVTSQQALVNLGAVAIASKGVPGGIAPLDGGAVVPVANLPPYPTLASLGGLAVSAVGVSVAPLDGQQRVPVANLPPFQAPVNFPLAIALGGTGIAAGNVADVRSALGVPASSSIGAAGGIAPLDGQQRVPVINLPPYPTLASLGALASILGFQRIARSTTSAINFATHNNTVAGVFRLIDGGVTHSDTPPGLSGGGFLHLQFDALLGEAEASKYQIQEIVQINNRKWFRVQNNGAWGAWQEYVFYTASGNLILPGTFRLLNSATNPTGASFVRGGMYWNTAINSGAGGLVISDGTSWRQIALGAVVS